MISKKSLLAGLASAALALPALASALTLDVYNNTNEDNTVRIKQSGLCSSIGGHITRAHSETHTAQAKVKMLCLLASTCDAVMYASNNCSGKPIAHLSLSTRDLVATLISLDNPHYTVALNRNRVEIGYAG